METTTNSNNKVYLCYSTLNKVSIDSLCKKLQKEGFLGVADGTELMQGKEVFVREAIKKCSYFVLIISNEFGEHMQEEYRIALEYKLNILVFLKSDLFRDGQISRKFDNRLVTLWEDENDLLLKVAETMIGFRYKYPERGSQFEILVEDLFRSYGCDTKRTYHIVDEYLSS